MAQTQQVSVSFAQLEKNSKQLTRDAFLKAKQDELLEANKMHSKQGEVRSQLQRNKKLANPAVKEHSQSDYYGFSIFTAQSQLLTDNDADGFYHGFSVTFDADYLRYDEYNQATVYAELYLRKKNGPWLHYYTTDSFVIHSDSTDDAYEVVTSLLDGYHSEYYDVLIDLYEVGYSDVIASYSSDDSNALYALPLESANYDRYVVVEEVYIEQGGSFSILLSLLLLLLFITRVFTKNTVKAYACKNSVLNKNNSQH
jgi:hypothetical protein